ncbi:MAG: hypothetical protein HY695_22900 [Deltaproteobacteria bacterium]|nr:hypothetical protein [Deltaproteobacteria bacterium]
MRGLKTSLSLTLLSLVILFSCAPLSRTIPAVTDETLERFLRNEAMRIVKVSENSDKAAMYQFRLVQFPRKDILGLSIGNHQIYISYELSRLAYRTEHHLWLFRHTLAHEIAHDVLGGEVGRKEPISRAAVGLANGITGRDLGLSTNIFFRSYSSAAELEADRKGLEYWQRLGWDCRIWIRIFEHFLNHGYQGDVDHPTAERLNQSREICPADARADQKKKA